MAMDLFPKPFYTAANTLFLRFVAVSLVIHCMFLLAIRCNTIKHDTSERFISVDLNAITLSPAPAARLKQANRTLPGQSSVIANNPVPAISADVSETPLGTTTSLFHRAAGTKAISADHRVMPVGVPVPAMSSMPPPPSVPAAQGGNHAATQLLTTISPSKPAGSQPATSGNAQAERAGYLAQIRNMIESHKEYPAMARKSGMEGTVHVRFVLDRDGVLKDADISRSSGKSLLDKAAVRAIANVARFPAIPESLNGSALIFEIPVIFKLKES
jgi:TonB family protein